MALHSNIIEYFNKVNIHKKGFPHIIKWKIWRKWKEYRTSQHTWWSWWNNNKGKLDNRVSTLDLNALVKIFHSFSFSQFPYSNWIPTQLNQFIAFSESQAVRIASLQLTQTFLRNFYFVVNEITYSTSLIEKNSALS